MISIILGELKPNEVVGAIIFLVFFGANIALASYFFVQMMLLLSNNGCLPYKKKTLKLLKKGKVISYTVLFFQMALRLLVLCFFGVVSCWICDPNLLSISLNGFLPFISIVGIASAAIFGNNDPENFIITKYLGNFVKQIIFNKFKEEVILNQQSPLLLLHKDDGTFNLRSMLRFPLSEKTYELDKKHMDIFGQKPNVQLSNMIVIGADTNINIDCTKGEESGDDFYVCICKDDIIKWQNIFRNAENEKGSEIRISLLYKYKISQFEVEDEFELTLNFNVNNSSLRIRGVYEK